MRAERLQLSLLPEQTPLVQPLPSETRRQCIDVIAKMLLHAAKRGGETKGK